MNWQTMETSGKWILQSALEYHDTEQTDLMVCQTLHWRLVDADSGATHGTWKSYEQSTMMGYGYEKGIRSVRFSPDGEGLILVAVDQFFTGSESGHSITEQFEPIGIEDRTAPDHPV